MAGLGIAGLVTALLLLTMVVLPNEINSGPSHQLETEMKLRLCAEAVVDAVRSGAQVSTLGPLVSGQMDAWGHPLEMLVQKSAVTHVQIVSMGKDGAWGTSDDLVVKRVLPR
jgi:hypothetical protein